MANTSQIRFFFVKYSTMVTMVIKQCICCGSPPSSQYIFSL